MRLSITTAALLALAAIGLAQENYSPTALGPLTLLIAYRTNPDQRVDLRRQMLQGGVARFQGWKNQGVLQDYHILFNSYLDSETYDMLSLLTFSTYADVARWREIEKEWPGGLSHETLRLVTSAVTCSLDSVRRNTAKDTPEPRRSLYFIIPYDYLVPAAEYVKYLDGYVVPQVDGWIAEEVLAGYTIYLSRYSTARPWGSIFVLEYRDSEAFGKREATVAKVRERLKANPAWLAASEGKQRVRVEKQTIIAEELVVK